jgi:hypothetical protein
MRHQPFAATVLALALAAAPALAQPKKPDAAPAAPAAADEPAGDDGSDASGDDGASEGAPAPGKSVDVDSLRQEYLALRDQLFRSRARAAAVASAMYSSKLRINLGYASARFYTVTRAMVRLDGASVYDDSQGELATSKAPRFDGFVSPGRHLVTVRIEATAKDDDRFTSATESTFAIQVPVGKDVQLDASAEDTGDIGYEWKKSEKGSYGLRLSVKVTTRTRPGKPAGKPQARRQRDGARRAAR